MKAALYVGVNGATEISLYPETAAEREILRQFKEKQGEGMEIWLKDDLFRFGYHNVGNDRLTITLKAKAASDGYASILGVSAALHLAVFEEPANLRVFDGRRGVELVGERERQHKKRKQQCDEAG